MSEKRTISVVQEVAAPAKQVYRAFASAQGLLEWIGDAVEADPRDGGRFYVWLNAGFYASGTYVHLEEDHKVAFTWRGNTDAEETRVRVLIEEAGDGAKITLFHDEVVEAAVEVYTKEWENSLANLKSVLENGVDRRLFDRPMLGFYIGGLVDDHLQDRLSLPVDYGVHVSGVLEGMGAERSGIQQDDVITVLDGIEIRRFPQIGDVLRKFKGGDTIDTVVYRGAERLELAVELSKRPIPDFPAAPAELAGGLAELYRNLLGDLKTALADVSEEESGRKPSEGEWSVKEVLAHLLISERWTTWALDLHPAGNKFPRYPGDNRTYEALAAVYSLEGLLKELKITVKLIVKLIGTLPEAYVDNKGAYFLMFNNYEQGVRTHFEQHTAQIRAAIETVRKGDAELAPA